MAAIKNGQREYGIVHVQEEEMREAGVGVFEASSTERRRRRKKDEGAAPANKARKAAPANKAAPRKRKAK